MVRAPIPLPDKQIALVTGGSRGIGRALAHEFASHGHALGLVARHAEALADAADELRRQHHARVQIYELDLTEAGASERLRAAVEADDLSVGYLVNNAGFWTSGSVGEAADADLERVVATNALVPLRLAKAFLPHLAANAGGILNVSSLAATLPTPTFAAYGASKAFLASLSGAMRYELRAQGVTVCTVLPGLVLTGFTSSRKGVLYRIVASPPETVAFAAYRGLLSGQSTVVPGLFSRIMYFGIKCLPRVFTEAVFSAATQWPSPRSEGGTCAHS